MGYYSLEDAVWRFILKYDFEQTQWVNAQDIVNILEIV